MAHHLMRRVVYSLLPGVAHVYNNHTWREEGNRKSKSDTREYRGLELDNGMKILLVRDPGSRTSAITMDVGVGSMKDPW